MVHASMYSGVCARRPIMNFIAKLIGMILQVTLNLFVSVKQKVESVEIKEAGDRARQSYKAFGEKIKEGREEMGYEASDLNESVTRILYFVKNVGK